MATQESTDAAPRASRPIRVLLADDYPDAAESAARFLSLAGLQTQVAYDGADALRRMAAWLPHVCVFDLAMPNIDGFELARRTRARPGDSTLLIAVTGWIIPGFKIAATSAGFDVFLRKPVAAEELLRIINARLLV